MVTGPEHFEKPRRACAAELEDLRRMQRLRAAELGPAHFDRMKRFFAAELEELRRLQRVRAAEHEVVALEDLKRIWKPRWRVACCGAGDIAF